MQAGPAAEFFGSRQGNGSGIAKAAAFEQKQSTRSLKRDVERRVSGRLRQIPAAALDRRSLDQSFSTPRSRPPLAVCAAKNTPTCVSHHCQILGAVLAPCPSRRAGQFRRDRAPEPGSQTKTVAAFPGITCLLRERKRGYHMNSSLSIFNATIAIYVGPNPGAHGGLWRACAPAPCPGPNQVTEANAPSHEPVAANRT